MSAPHTPAEPLDLLGLPRPALAAALPQLGVPAHHALRIFGGLHKRGRPLHEIPDLGHRTVAALQAGTFIASARVIATAAAEDTESPEGAMAGVIKMLFELSDGARVEGVLIPMRPGRYTLCVSSQVGCAMGCAFCATATLGLTRGLKAGEIIAQLHGARAQARARGGELTHVVFMGMGEPLHNWPAVEAALAVMLDGAGLSLQSRHVTVSTVGLIPKVAQLAARFEGRVQLALSLHAGTDETRRRIIPPARRYPMADLKRALLDYPLPGSRALMLEYVVLPGVNDSPEELAALAEWTSGLRALVNLIPFNPFGEVGFRAPTEAEVLRVFQDLDARGVPTRVRWPRGRAVDGACGQLALREGAERA